MPTRHPLSRCKDLTFPPFYDPPQAKRALFPDLSSHDYVIDPASATAAALRTFLRVKEAGSRKQEAGQTRCMGVATRRRMGIQNRRSLVQSKMRLDNKIVEMQRRLNTSGLSTLNKLPNLAEVFKVEGVSSSSQEIGTERSQVCRSRQANEMTPPPFATRKATRSRCPCVSGCHGRLGLMSQSYVSGSRPCRAKNSARSSSSVTVSPAASRSMYGISH